MKLDGDDLLGRQRRVGLGRLGRSGFAVAAQGDAACECQYDKRLDQGPRGVTPAGKGPGELESTASQGTRASCIVSE